MSWMFFYIFFIYLCTFPSIFTWSSRKKKQTSTAGTARGHDNDKLSGLMGSDTLCHQQTVTDPTTHRAIRLVARNTANRKFYSQLQLRLFLASFEEILSTPLPVLSSKAWREMNSLFCSIIECQGYQKCIPNNIKSRDVNWKSWKDENSSLLFIFCAFQPFRTTFLIQRWIENFTHYIPIIFHMLSKINQNTKLWTNKTWLRWFTFYLPSEYISDDMAGNKYSTLAVFASQTVFRRCIFDIFLMKIPHLGHNYN